MSQRILRVRELLKRELSAILLRDYPADGCLITITDVDVTPDFREATAFIGIVGDKNKGNKVFHKLNHDSGQIQKKMSKRVVLRNTPVLTFKMDESIARGVRILDAIQFVDSLPLAIDSDLETESESDKKE
jgi:ribosome-binding factor A